MCRFHVAAAQLCERADDSPALQLLNLVPKQAWPVATVSKSTQTDVEGLSTATSWLSQQCGVFPPCQETPSSRLLANRVEDVTELWPHVDKCTSGISDAMAQQQAAVNLEIARLRLAIKSAAVDTPDKPAAGLCSAHLMRLAEVIPPPPAAAAVRRGHAVANEMMMPPLPPNSIGQPPMLSPTPQVALMASPSFVAGAAMTFTSSPELVFGHWPRWPCVVAAQHVASAPSGSAIDGTNLTRGARRRRLQRMRRRAAGRDGAGRALGEGPPGGGFAMALMALPPGEQETTCGESPARSLAVENLKHDTFGQAAEDSSAGAPPDTGKCGRHARFPVVRTFIHFSDEMNVQETTRRRAWSE